MRCPTCSFSRGAIAPFALVGIFAFACVPVADALVVSSSGTEITTNTSSTGAAVQYAWDRTVYLDAGTGVYLGCDGNGTYYILTAAHVSTSSGSSASIASSDGMKYSYTIASSSSTILTNSDGSSADLKVVAITSTDSSALSYLQSLGTTSIYTSSLTSTSSQNQGGPPGMNSNSSTTLYVVGTGKVSSIGSSYSTGDRTKTWGAFAFGDNNTYEKSTSSVANGSYTTTCYMEFFSTTGNCVIACECDSGSGVWVADSDSLALAGIVLYVARGGSAETINYYETDSTGYWATYYADLSQYYEQIAAILAVPEPSAFALLAGAGALALVAARRRKRTRSRRAS